MMKIWPFVGGIALASAAQGASFDCSRATLVDERTVCANRALNDRDVTMSVLYNLNRKMMAMGSRGNLIDEQQAWMTARRRCRTNQACLTRIYDRRIAELRAFIDTRVVTHGPF